MEKMPVSASWQKRFLDYLTACPSLKQARVQKIFSSLQLNCSGTRYKYNIQELKKAWLEFHSLEKSGGERSFGLVCCLDEVAGTREGGLTEGRDVGIGGRATVGVGTRPVISWVSCCNWVVRPTRVVLIACSEAFWHLVNSWRWCYR